MDEPVNEPTAIEKTRNANRPPETGRLYMPQDFDIGRMMGDVIATHQELFERSVMPGLAAIRDSMVSNLSLIQKFNQRIEMLEDTIEGLERREKSMVENVRDLTSLMGTMKARLEGLERDIRAATGGCQ